MIGEIYCTACRDVVDGVPFEHRKEVHDGNEYPEIVRIVDKQDGYYIAQQENMGHRTPHVWTEAGEHEICAHCDAVRVPKEVGEP